MHIRYLSTAMTVPGCAWRARREIASYAMLVPDMAWQRVGDSGVCLQDILCCHAREASLR
eukprot:822166-Rhodomonas_salina.1